MMKKEAMVALYEKYYTERSFEREEVFGALKEKYSISSALYPGSYIHITPSFFYPSTIYVDNDSVAKKFFGDLEQVKTIIKDRKTYSEKASVEFHGQSYHKKLPLKEGSMDLLISHYAGIISQPCKKYLRMGGYLLANNSHADAGVAYLDEDYKLIAVIHPNRKNVISEAKLDQYFVPKKKHDLRIADLIHIGVGMGYTKTAGLYLFQRKS